MRIIAKAALVAVCIAGGSTAVSAQTADEIAEKALAALGGRAAHEKLTNRATIGTMTVAVAGMEFQAVIEVLNEAPNKARTLITLDLSAAGAGSVVIDQRFDGTSGYVMDSMRGNSEMSAGQVQGQRNTIFPSPLLNYKERGTKLELAGKEKVADRDAYVLTVTPASGPVTRLYVDAESYLVVRGVAAVEMPDIGNIEQTVDLSDYRVVDGIKVPFRLKGSSSVQTFTINVTKVEHNVKIDPALFSKPAAK